MRRDFSFPFEKASTNRTTFSHLPNAHPRSRVSRPNSRCLVQMFKIKTNNLGFPDTKTLVNKPRCQSLSKDNNAVESSNVRAPLPGGSRTSPSLSVTSHDLLKTPFSVSSFLSLCCAYVSKAGFHRGRIGRGRPRTGFSKRPVYA